MMVNNLKILLVDGEADFCEIIEEVLTLDGYQVFSFRNSAQAFQNFAEIEPHIVITDLNLPGDRGTGLIAKIREFGSQIPVILLTGECKEEAVVASERFSNVKVMEKPFVLDQLRGHLQTLMASSC